MIIKMGWEKDGMCWRKVDLFAHDDSSIGIVHFVLSFHEPVRLVRFVVTYGTGLVFFSFARCSLEGFGNAK